MIKFVLKQKKAVNLNHLRAFSTGKILEEGEFIEASIVPAYKQKSIDMLFQNLQEQKVKYEEVNSSLNDFKKKFGLPVESEKAAESSNKDYQEIDSFLAELETATQEITLSKKEISQSSNFAQEVEDAIEAQQMLKQFLDGTNYITRVSREDFERSSELRREVMQQKDALLMKGSLNSQTQKEFSSDTHKTFSQMQSYIQSDQKNQVEKFMEMSQHNKNMDTEYKKGEEGIDYIYKKNPELDARLIDVAKMKADARAQLNEMKITEPALAAYYEEKLFKRNEVDDVLDEDWSHIDLDKIIKFYPGSKKGPLPEDDPENYSEWFIRNQPNMLLYGEEHPDYHDIGVRYKWQTSQKFLDEDAMQVEKKDHATAFLEHEELYPMQNYQGVAEFDIADRDLYSETIPGKLPYLRFSTQMMEEDLGPLPENYTQDYSKVHWELERWTLFTSLPELVKHSRNLSQTLDNIQSGAVIIPDYVKDHNPPSLWTYYSTLPSWAQNDPHIKRVMMGLEYHQPHQDIRSKENMLNFACSFLRPMDTVLRKVVVEAAASVKVEINMKSGQTMLNELTFYEIDEHYLGSDSGEEEGEGDDEEEQLQKLIAAKKRDQSEEINDDDLTPMQLAVRVMDQEYRLEDMEKAATQEMNINQYKVEPATNKCMTDFHTFIMPEVDDIVSEVAGEIPYVPAAELPINYYDNDDGFWDDYIKQKQRRGEEAGYLTKRMYFQH